MRTSTLFACLSLLVTVACSNGNDGTPDAGNAPDASGGDTDGGGDGDASLGNEDGGSDPAIAECQALADALAATCEGSAPRPCVWSAYRELCSTGNTALLIESMHCFDDAPACRSFSDPNEAASCLTAAHSDGQSAAARTAITQICTACGGSNCESPMGALELLPYLSDADLAMVATCGETACSLDDIITACGSVPGVAAFVECN